MKKLIIDRSYKVCTILYLLAIINWLFVIATTYVTNIAPNNFLGIVSRLPIYFFIAIFLTIISVKYAYDNENMIMSAIGSLIFPIILFLTYPLIEPNASFAFSYYPSGMVKEILENGHVSLQFRDNTYIYLYYTNFQIFTSLLVAVTKLRLDFIIKYFHFLLIFIITIFISLTYKSISKNWKLAIVGSLFFSVFLWSEQLYYGPQLFAFFFMSILYFVLIKYIDMKNIPLAIIAILLFVDITTTHLLSSVMLISFTFILYISTILKKVPNNKLKSFLMPFFDETGLKQFLIPFSTISISWLIYEAISFLTFAIKDELGSLTSPDTYIQDITLGRTLIAETINYTIVFNIRIFFMGLSFLLSFIGIYLILKNKEYIINKAYVTAIFWIVGAFQLLLISYGGEIIQRVYLYSLIGMIFYVAYLFTKSNRSGVIFSAILILAIFHPIAFAGDSAFKLISNSEISGDKFFVNKTTKNSVFYILGNNILKYEYPSWYRKMYGLRFPPEKHFSLPLNGYIIRSEIGTNGLYYYLNYDPLSEKFTGLDKIYDNMNFSIYNKIKLIKST